MVFLAGHSISTLEFRRDMSDKDVFPYHTGLLRDAQNTVRRGMVYAFSSADDQVAITKEGDMKDNFLYPVTEATPRTEEHQFLPCDVAVMWVSGLGATQTTPRTSDQAAPAPQPEDWN